MKIKLPLNHRSLTGLRAGDEITLTGTVYTARDAAHRKMMKLIEMGRPLPFKLKDNLIYYCGPTPARPGQIIGAAGPTTSSRMDPYAATLYRLGLKATLGKGPRSQEVVAACKKFGAVYLDTYGGLGAYLTQFIKKSKLIAFPDLGPEAIYQLEIADFPAIVAIDSRGQNIF